MQGMETKKHVERGIEKLDKNMQVLGQRIAEKYLPTLQHWGFWPC